MLEAGSVALVGASARPGSLGARMIEEVARSPARPRTYLVNPRYADINGVPCLPSLAELPEPVDLALLAVPDSALEAQLDAAARARARSAHIFGWGSPFNRRRLTLWIVLAGACITRGQRASSRRGSAPMRIAWTTWSGCAGPAGSSASAAVMPAGGG